MPLLFIVVGLALIVVAIRNSQSQLYSLLQADLPGFLKWVAAIVAIGILGFIPQLRTPSRLLLALVAIVIVVQNKGGLFSQFTTAFTTASPSQTTGVSAQNLTSIPVTLTVQGSSGGIAGASTLTGALGISDAGASTAGSALGAIAT